MPASDGLWFSQTKNYEHLPEVSEAMVTLAMIRLMAPSTCRTEVAMAYD